MNESFETQVMTYVQSHMDTIPFKTLRFGEEELDQDEKLRQMNHFLQTDPGLFLSKWGRYLSQPILSLFSSIKDNYEVDFYLDSLLFKETPQETQKQAFKKSSMHQLAQNRRYEFLQRQLRHSEYFSDENMQLRDPVLYEQFVGCHIPPGEKMKPFEQDVTLVQRIYSNMDKKYVDDHLQEQRVVDEEQFEEEDESEDEELIEKSTPTVVTKGKQVDSPMKNGTEKEEDSDPEAIEDRMAYREEQRLELIKLLEERFLAGKDDFDYDMVDYNEEYDNLKQQEQDIHDHYFDEDD